MAESDTDEELAMIRTLKHRRQNQERKEKRAKHANALAKYRARLARKKAPNRMDFLVVTLGIVLRAIDPTPEQALIRLLRAAIEDEFVQANFDREQVRVRLNRMLEDCNDDLNQWRHTREWLQEHKALIARALDTK